MVVVVAASLAAGALLYHRSLTQHTSTTLAQLSMSPPAPSTYTAIAGQPLELSVGSFTASPGSYVLFYVGNGSVVNSTSGYATVVYRYPGRYLVYYAIYYKGRLVGSSQGNLIQITVAPPQLNESFAQLITVPVVAPSTFVANVDQPVSLSAGFLQPPSGANMTIEEYVWDLGNGTTLTIPSVNGTGYAEQVALTGSGNVSYLEPKVNPVTIMYARPGLYTVCLTIVTENVSSGATYNYTSCYTIAVSSRVEPFSLFSPQASVPNPGTIVVAENVPGGPFSFDPAIAYDTTSFEVIDNIFASLLLYDGPYTNKFIPMAAEYLPTVGNWTNVTARYEYGAISPNYTIYVFKIRPGLRAANGDPITAYDVWYSLVRDLLLAGGVPSTRGWILAQYLIPNYTPFTFIVTSPNDTQGAEEIVNAITYSNATDTVTFHLVRPVAPQVFFTALAEAWGPGILDAKWLEEVGDGINLTGLYDHNYTQLAEAFYQYEQTANEWDYNEQVRWDPMATGPYYIAAYTPGQSIVLKPNPYWPTNITYVPRPNDTIVIYWVKDPETAYEMFASGQVDMVVNLPDSFIPKVLQLESEGEAEIYEFPSLLEEFFGFDLQVNENLLHSINPAYSIPSWYFANPLVREAFAYAFNYTQYINDIVGNAKYHFNFGSPYCGAIIKGLDIYIPPSELTGCPTFNLTYAKELMEESGFYNISVYFPIVITAGDTTDFTAAEMWAQALHDIDPNINAAPLYLPWTLMLSYWVPDLNPMAIWNSGYVADYPLASDMMNAQYTGMVWADPDGWNVTYLENLSAYFNASKISWPGLNASVEPQIGKMLWQEAMEYQELQDLIAEADSVELTNATASIPLFRQAEDLAVQLYFYVYTIQPNSYWVVKPYMAGYMGTVAWEENPMIAGGNDNIFWWWVKA
ncbi:MAG: Bacterial extracellular solute-binding protein, family 5 Middle [uncultured Acidilobus sp. OSP8]|nr:MAG: Bacterial extracellular solute-binding protein, family 5 Middle [uncultured Acidilobus sp. OSP8]